MYNHDYSKYYENLQKIRELETQIKKLWEENIVLKAEWEQCEKYIFIIIDKI